MGTGTGTARSRRSNQLATVAVVFVATLIAVAPAGAAGTVQVRECGQMTTPSGKKAWAYTSALYQCPRARKILRAWLFDGAGADLRGWRCFSATQAGQIVTCRRGVNRVHMQLSGRRGQKLRVD